MIWKFDNLKRLELTKITIHGVPDTSDKWFTNSPRNIGKGRFSKIKERHKMVWKMTEL